MSKPKVSVPVEEVTPGQFKVGQFPTPNTLVKLQVPTGINEVGIAAIKDLLATQNIVLPDDWAWTWIKNGRGVYVGTLPRRLSKWAWKNHQIELSAPFLSTIGNLALQNTIKAAEYTLDFTQKFDWKPGDFGDRGSCFWGGAYFKARFAMMQHNFWAIRFWEQTGRRGTGRAWIMPHECGWVVFNGYGCTPDGEILTTRIAGRVLAQFWSTYYRYIALHEGCSNVYVNSGSAVLVGNQSAVKDIDTISSTIRYQPEDHCQYDEYGRRL